MGEKSMRIRLAFCVALVALSGITGCGKSAGPGAAESAKSADTPDKPLTVFLKAICANDQETMFEMLTDTAREALRERGMSPGMNSGDDATYEVIEFEYVDEGAHVACNWIEKQENGAPLKTPVIWIMHKQPKGWRVAGMALRVFDDMRPVFFNFEDPVDMVHKQELIDQEIARREQDHPTQ
jgi:hypothetical protein